MLDEETYFTGKKSSLVDILYYCELQAVYKARKLKGEKTHIHLTTWEKKVEN